MAKKICPFMNLATSFLYANPNVETRDIKVQSNACAKADCQLWENGDCGLKVARGSDKSKEMWERLIDRVFAMPGTETTFSQMMNEVEAEVMGKGKKALPKEDKETLPF